MLLLLLLLSLGISHRTLPGVSASVVLRGRWSATVDDVDADVNPVQDDSGAGQLRGLMQLLRDHQRRSFPPATPLDLPRQLTGDRFSPLDSERVSCF